MSEWLALLLTLLPALLAGVVLGTIFFGGLWWTIRRATSSRLVALWFLASLLLRTAIVVGGFLLVCAGDWRRWLIALLGFAVARLVVTRVTLTIAPCAESDHAS
ncbi:MAG: ATP synthase subunit I [Propionivibrio sp.]